MNGKFRLAALILIIAVLSGCGSIRPENVDDRKISNYLPEKVEENVLLGGMNVGGYGKKELNAVLTGLALKTDLKPTEAALNSKSWEVASQDKPGRMINIEQTLHMVFDAREGQTVYPVIEEARPSITAERLKGNIVQTAQYSTPLRDKTPARTTNIRLAASKLDYVQIKPGIEFSFNRAVGQRTPAQGFLEAPIIVRTDYGYKVDEEAGGGICQVSTTLYNAVLQCGFDITERHMHSGDITYAPKGKDATVYYGNVDFRFKNNGKYPVMLRVSMDANNITVRIFENRN